MDERELSRVHYLLVRGLIDSGKCPTSTELAGRLAMSVADVEALLRGLSDIHGVVLHPHACEPWIVHPFSTTPTPNWVEGQDRGWWAPCIWCALGVATLVGGEVAIHTRYGAESEPLVIPVRDGEPEGFDELWVHFAIPPRRAWDNVHQHCALVLPFRSPQDITAWCGRHGVPAGQSVPLLQVARLARSWYGAHANPAWRKWTVPEAQEIFRRSGLTSAFWDLGSATGRF
jgi:hypothetical protein